MIISVEDLKLHLNKDINNEVLAIKLRALEQLVRKYTNNNFQNTKIRFRCEATERGLHITSPYLTVGDTIQITQSKYNDGLYTIEGVGSEGLSLNKTLFEEKEVLVTKVEYPEDVVLGVINLIKWDIENRAKVGIQSETISRHSVTYFNMDGDNSKTGYPKSLMGFLDLYKKARF